MELFYTEPDRIRGTTITLDAFERKHILQILRKSHGAEIHVTDGCGNLYHTQMVQEKPDLVLEIREQQTIPRPAVSMELAIGFIRPARLEFVFEKCTELGVQTFHLVRTTHANFTSSNTGRYQKILRQAIKQSQQFYLPRIQTYDSIEDFLKIGFQGKRCIAAIDAKYPILFQKIQAPNGDNYTSFLYIVGPEGGFAQSELARLLASDFEPVGLGPNRLRAETAAISGISCIQQYIFQ